VKKIDDPKTPEFASWDSYDSFARRVRNHRRFILEPEARAFLDTVRATLKGRNVKIGAGTILYRAQRGVDYDPFDDGGEEIAEGPHGFGPKRMKPQPNRANEGRVNPAGIPVLYLASDEQVAISEVRPWTGSEISVAQFRILRDLKGVNLTLGHGKMSIGHLKISDLLGGGEPDAAAKEKAVWIEIDNAFSRPVTLSDDTADYVPTQILAEFFRDAGYDAVIYRSQFGKKGHNIAIFNVNDAEAINGAPYEVTEIEVKYKEIGNRWFSKPPDAGV
jgi:hypothetical protein